MSKKSNGIATQKNTDSCERIKNIHKQYHKNAFYDGITQGYLLIFNSLGCIMKIQPAKVEKLLLPLLSVVGSERAYISGQLPGGF